jgi:hypothetical protein
MYILEEYKERMESTLEEKALEEKIAKEKLSSFMVKFDKEKSMKEREISILNKELR